MKLTIGKKLQSKTTGKIAAVASEVIDGFITMKFEDGTEKHFAEYVIQERWQEKIDKNFKAKVEENKVIQSTQEAHRKVSLGNKKQKQEFGFPRIMFTWVKYGRKKDATNRWAILQPKEKEALKIYFKVNDVDKKHINWLKSIGVKK